MKTLFLTLALILSLSGAAYATEVDVDASASVEVNKSRFKLFGNIFDQRRDDRDDDKGGERGAELKGRFDGKPEVEKINTVEGMKARASAEIDRRIASLQKFQTKIDAMKRVSDSAKASIKATVIAQINELTTLRAKIQADTDEATLKADIQSIAKSYRIYMLVMPQLSILMNAERIMTTADLMSEFGVKLKTRIDTAATAGTDVTELNKSYDSMKAHIAEAKVDAQAAINLSASLKPDNGDDTVMKANQKALQDARAKLKTAHDDLQGARKDIGAILKRLKVEVTDRSDRND